MRDQLLKIPLQNVPELNRDELQMSYEIYAYVRHSIAESNDSEPLTDEWLQAIITQWTVINRKRLNTLDDDTFYTIYTLGLELVLLHERPQPMSIN